MQFSLKARLYCYLSRFKLWNSRSRSNSVLLPLSLGFRCRVALLKFSLQKGTRCGVQGVAKQAAGSIKLSRFADQMKFSLCCARRFAKL